MNHFMCWKSNQCRKLNGFRDIPSCTTIRKKFCCDYLRFLDEPHRSRIEPHSTNLFWFNFILTRSNLNKMGSHHRQTLHHQTSPSPHSLLLTLTRGDILPLTGYWWGWQVSNDEFTEFLRQSRYNNRVDPYIFSSLDSNNYNGFLDFIEVFTLFYIIRSRHVMCAKCAKCLMWLYFTCDTCFDNTASNTSLL